MLKGLPNKAALIVTPVRLFINLLYSPLGCRATTIWNHLELHVHLRSNRLLISESFALCGARHIIACDTIHLYIGLPYALLGCPVATIWNHLELDERMQSNWFFAYGSRVLGVVRYSGMAGVIVRLHIGLL